MSNDSTNYKCLIGRKIRDRRIQLGFKTQEQLAKKIGVEQGHVSRWESGKHMPEGHLRATLAEVLKVEPDFFENIESNHADIRLKIKEQLDATPKSEIQMADFVFEILEENKSLAASLMALKKTVGVKERKLSAEQRSALNEFVMKVSEGIVDINSLPQDKEQSATMIELKKIGDTLNRPILFKYLHRLLESEPHEILSILHLTGKNLQKEKVRAHEAKPTDSESKRKEGLSHGDRHNIRKVR